MTSAVYLEHYLDSKQYRVAEKHSPVILYRIQLDINELKF